MKTIPLTQGKFTTVDDEDYQRLSGEKWYAMKNKNTWYSVRQKTIFPGIQKMILMHREIMNTPEGMDTDHRDGYGLNNQRDNLRVCAKVDNRHNSPVRKDSSSGYKGVRWNDKQKSWQARIVVSGKHIHVGYFSNKEDAARAYDKVAKQQHGEFFRSTFKDKK